MTNVLKKSGVKRTKINCKKFDKSLIYGFRKRLNTTLKIDNDVNSNIAEKLMGHKNGLDGIYLTPSTDQCFAEFRKAINEITIDESAKLRIENIQLKDQNAEATKQQVLDLFDIQEVEIQDVKDILEQRRKDHKYK